jgi:GMP synthase-like glutamine amidotransferase
MTASGEAQTQAEWRRVPGYVEGGSNYESAHVLFSYYLRDRTSPNPLAEPPLTAPDGSFEWSERPILEKVIRSRADRLRYESSPALVRSGVAILEPWQDVGGNKFKERVRASKNIAYVLQRIANADSVLFPLWETGVPDPEHLASLVSNALAVVFEGGNPSVYDPSSFSANCPREDLLRLVEALLLARRPHSAPCIFICLAHQMVAEAHVRLIRRAVQDVLAADALGQDARNEAIGVLRLVCERIRDVGEQLAVIKNGRVVAEGWMSATFGVARNEQPEMAIVPLVAYRTSSATAARVPFELVHSHAVVAHEHKEKGIIVRALAHEAEVRVAMFHSDEVNEEAILFCNWAYRLLHESIIPYRHHVAASRLAWLLQLPYAVEITCATALPDGSAMLTEVAATCVLYKDYETSRLRRSFTLQFHPELSTDLREIGRRPPPSYAELKSDPGVRLLVRQLYAGMLE